MDCEKASKLLAVLVDGALPDGEASAVKAHADGCAACAARKRRLEAARLVFVGLKAEGAPAGFAERLRERLEPRPLRRRSLEPFIRWVPALAIAAVAMLIVIGKEWRPAVMSAPVLDQQTPALDAGRLGYEPNQSPCSSMRYCG